MTMPPPSTAKQLIRLEMRNLVAEVKGPVWAEAEYRMFYVARDNKEVHTEWKLYTLETLGDDWESYNPAIVMGAIDLGLGDQLLQTTISHVLPMTTEAFDIFLPLFPEDERVVCAEFVLSKHETNRHYGRLGMRLFASSGNLTMNAPSYSRAGDVFADLGFVSANWTMRLVINAASQWFSIALADLTDQDYAPLVNSCTGRKHKFTQDRPTSRELIDLLVTGKCTRCHNIERALSVDVPF